MTKIAVILPGLSRTYKETHESLINLLDMNDFNYDIYIDTWDISGKVIRDKRSDFKIDDKPWVDTDNYIDKSDIERIYNPKKIRIESWEKWLIDNKNLIKNWIKKHNYKHSEQHALNSLLAHHYKNKKCFELIEGDYDLVFKVRMDIFFQSPKKIEIDPSYLYFDHYFRNNNGVQDTWVLGGYNNMNIFTNIYDYLLEVEPHELDIIKGSTRFGWQYIPEILVKYYINKNNIEERIFNLGEKLKR